MMRRGLANLARLARPLWLGEARCQGCGRVALAGLDVGPDAGATLCADCHAALTALEGQACGGCGQPLEGAFPQAGPCPDCRERPRPWGRLVCFGAYDGRLRELILAYKFEARLGLGQQLQECLAGAFERAAQLDPELAACELIVPVPLHPRRLTWRGFNQSRELARLLSRRTRLPIVQQALTRVRRTVPQMELKRAERAVNIRGAFAADAEILAGRTALLVDDIMTTGSTLEECARMMLAAGAARVHVLVLARA